MWCDDKNLQFMFSFNQRTCKIFLELALGVYLLHQIIHFFPWLSIKRNKMAIIRDLPKCIIKGKELDISINFVIQIKYTNRKFSHKTVKFTICPFCKLSVVLLGELGFFFYFNTMSLHHYKLIVQLFMLWVRTNVILIY